MLRIKIYGMFSVQDKYIYMCSAQDKNIPSILWVIVRPATAREQFNAALFLESLGTPAIESHEKIINIINAFLQLLV